MSFLDVEQALEAQKQRVAALVANPLLTMQQTSALLSVPIETLRKLAYAKKFHSVKVGGRRMVQLSEIERLRDGIPQ